MKKYNVFNFTNGELREFAQDYISSKLKREFIIVNNEFQKHPDGEFIEFFIEVQDMAGRKYTFRFYLSEFYFECFAKGENSVHEIKENSNHDVALMEILLSTYINKFSLDYLDLFSEYQINLERGRYEEALLNAKFDARSGITNEHKRNVEMLGLLFSRVKEKVLSKKV